MSVGKFVAIHGTVIRVSNVKPLVKKMAFSCNLCNETQVSISGVFACFLPAILGSLNPLSSPPLPTSFFIFLYPGPRCSSAFSPSNITLFTLSPTLSFWILQHLPPFLLNSPSFPLFLLDPLPTFMYLLPFLFLYLSNTFSFFLCSPLSLPPSPCFPAPPCLAVFLPPWIPSSLPPSPLFLYCLPPPSINFSLLPSLPWTLNCSL